MANTVIKMPQLGESVSEGTIGRWLKNPGDRIEVDEPLVEIQTDKVNAEVQSPVAGILQQILLPEGTTAAVKSDMAIIGDETPTVAETPVSADAPGAQGPEGTTTHRAPAASAASAPPARTFTYDKTAGGGVVGTRGDEDDAHSSVSGAEEPGVKRFYTPVVLRMAEEHAIDLTTIQGSGAHGRVTRKDVERAIADPRAAASASPPGGAQATSASPPGGAQATSARPDSAVTAPAAAPPTPVRPSVSAGPVAGAEDRPLSPMRRAIAEHMTRARAEIPDAWSLVEIDLTNLVRQRHTLQAEWQARAGYELTYLPFFIKAVVACLQAVPELNATWAGDHVRLYRQHNLGIAVSLDNGLVVPVMRDADQLSVAGIATALRQIVQKARSGKLSLADLEGATFTVNNPGSLGSIMSQPIVPVGQAGIITMEAIVKRPVVLAEDAIAVRHMMNSCLSFDHRVLDGAGALKFLRELKRQLETVEYPLY
ncbi:MAG TPA: dihydrolipoamide acetyltransferase family protein [Chloroflexota bacterium]|nr:dihydrolipoamide acetyltransferase family protein [Chloroflexota bacterium]